jgi:hypothetical protein
MIETRRVVGILTDLEGVNEDLLNLYEDIKDNIDPRDAASRLQGPRDLAEYAEKLGAFEQAAADLRALVERITHVDMRSYAVSAPAEQPSALAGLKAHSPSEWFTSTHIVGFTLFGQPFIVSKWYRFYATLLQQFAARYPERFQALPDSFPYNADQHYTSFSRAPDGYRIPLELPYGVYTNVAMAVKGMIVNVRRLLEYFNVPESELVIYLREDRDAEEAG